MEIRLQIRLLTAAAPVCNLPDSIRKGLTIAVFANQVADFGMSRIHSDLQQACSQGTITHMPPELLCEGQMHRSTDVWSFGVLLWEMYTGQRPWHDMSYKQLMQTIGQDKQSPQWPAGAPATLAVSVQSVAAVGDFTVASRDSTVPSVFPHRDVCLCITFSIPKLSNSTSCLWQSTLLDLISWIKIPDLEAAALLAPAGSRKGMPPSGP